MAAAPQPRALTIHHLPRHLVVVIVVTMAAAATCTQAAASAHTTAAPAPRAATESPSPAAMSFLRARCATTLYPALCYDSLLPYASEVQENPARLARVAADVAAARLRSLSARVKDIIRHGGGAEPAEGGGGRPSETAALRECASTVSSAASLARQSSAELTKLEPDAAGGTTSSSSAAAGGGISSSSRQARWEVSNAKTWLSAAMTNEGTCSDGLVEAGDAATASPAGKEVTAGVAAVKQYTSIALALVNGIPV